MSGRSAGRHALVLGCGRSGTSILGELFEHIDGYEYLSEPPFAEIVGRVDTGDALAAKVPKSSAGYPPDPGLSFPMSSLLEARPDTVVLWIVRHPLDAISSLRPGIADGWGHHPRPADWQAWASRSLVEKCAHHWANINDVGFSQVAPVANVVKFEDMIAEPHALAARVCDLVGAPGQDRSRVGSWAMRVQNSNNDRFVEAKTSRNYSRPDHAVRVGRWRENLSAEDVEVGVGIVATAASTFGYELGDL